MRKGNKWFKTHKISAILVLETSVQSNIHLIFLQNGLEKLQLKEEKYEFIFLMNS